MNTMRVRARSGRPCVQPCGWSEGGHFEAIKKRCAGFAADGTDGSGAKTCAICWCVFAQAFFEIVTAFSLVCLAFLFVCVLLCEQTTEKYMNTRERCVLGITRTHTTQEQTLSPVRGCVLLNLSMDGNTSRHHSRHESRGKRQRASAAWRMEHASTACRSASLA